MNFMLLSETVTEEVVETTNTDVINETLNKITLIPAPTLRLIILGVIVAAICAYFIFKPTEERKNLAKKYLNDLATNIMSIILANLDFKVNSFTGKIEANFDDFKQDLLDEIYKESWDFVETALKQAVKEGKIDSIAAKYIKKESVESLVDLIISRDDILQKVKKAYDYMSNEVLMAILKEEEKARKEAEEAEAQEEEPSDPVTEDSVEAFGIGEGAEDANAEDLYEPYEMEDLADEIISGIDKDAVG